MKSFDDAFTALMNVERGYWDDPAGGPTMYGVTQAVALAAGYTGDMRLLPLPLAKSIAKTQYWDKYQCDQFDPIIGFQVFDAAYNGGHPAQWLQTAVGAAPDGVIGAATISAVRRASPAAVVLSFNAQRLFWMTGLDNWTPNAKGWARRIASNMSVI